MKTDEIFMQRALQLAEKGLGNTYPNPMVGSVIVHKGKIIGEGWHQKAGEAHAEINAIASVKNKDKLKESTIYVNLEPCAHYGRTPPCAMAIVKSNFKRVVIGCLDSFSKVNGQGIAMLKEAGIEVVVGVLEKESQQLNARFFTYHSKKRPYIILKWAETLDGFIDVNRKVRQINQAKINWITNAYSRQKAHEIRYQEAAILIGSNTLKNDNPSLDIRSYANNGITKIVLDRKLIITKAYKIFQSKDPVFIVNTKEDKIEGNVRYLKIPFDENLIENLLEKLYELEVCSLIVEGGSYTLNQFIAKELWDEARVFTGINHFEQGLKAPVITGKCIGIEKIQTDELKTYKAYGRK